MGASDASPAYATAPALAPLGVPGERVWIDVTHTNTRITRYGLPQGAGGTVLIQVLTRDAAAPTWTMQELELPAAEFRRFGQ